MAKFEIQYYDTEYDIVCEQGVQLVTDIIDDFDTISELLENYAEENIMSIKRLD